MMQYHQYQPQPALQPFIASYFSMRISHGHPNRELILPDGTPGLLFIQHGGFRRESVSGKGDQVTHCSLFGQKSTSVYYSLETPGLMCFGIKFQPTGLHALTGVMASELTDRMERAEDVMGTDFIDLEDQLAWTSHDLQKVHLLERYFIKRCLTEDHLHLTNALLDDIHNKRGSVDIADLSRRFGLSYKRIERLFQKYAGLAPKTWCRLTRFHAALQASKKNTPGNLARLGYEAGYYDQMHFIREVRRFTGMTPKQLFGEGLGLLGMHQQSLLSDRLKLIP